MTFFRHAEPNYPARATVGDNIALHSELALGSGSKKATLGAYAVSRHREDERTFVLQRQNLVPGWLKTQIVVQPDAAQGGYTVGTLSPGHRLFSRVFGQPDLPTSMADEDAAIVSANVSYDQDETRRTGPTV